MKACLSIAFRSFRATDVILDSTKNSILSPPKTQDSTQTVIIKKPFSTITAHPMFNQNSEMLGEYQPTPISFYHFQVISDLLPPIQRASENNAGKSIVSQNITLSIKCNRFHVKQALSNWVFTSPIKFYPAVPTPLSLPIKFNLHAEAAMYNMTVLHEQSWVNLKHQLQHGSKWSLQELPEPGHMQNNKEFMA